METKSTRKCSITGSIKNTTHCRSGLHEWIPENIGLKGSGKRYCKICRNNARSIRYNNGYKEKIQEYNRKSMLRYFYDMSIEDYNIMLQKQDYKCKICGVEAKSLKRGLVVDHCHETQKVRGLLCSNCNTGLGQFKDNIKSLKEAINYLK